MFLIFSSRFAIKNRQRKKNFFLFQNESKFTVKPNDADSINFIPIMTQQCYHQSNNKMNIKI